MTTVKVNEKFGSYSPTDVTWLLKDLSGVELEAPLEEREEAVQSGKSHYAESLPIEYHPDEEYTKLFLDALYGEEAEQTAEAVAKVTEQVLNNRGTGENTVLVSLARAGTPVGILMRRYAQVRYGYDLKHYAISIIRGRGIDANALDYIAQHHDPKNVIFVDGWTGKGAITHELREAIREYNAQRGSNYSSELAVLADPADSATFYGTQEDFLIPSACLNSTVSGLISRTVLNDSFIGESDFHGAKFYKEFSDRDYSVHLIDTISQKFESIIERGVSFDQPNTNPQWTGMKMVRDLADEMGANTIHLIKPGVGETTRVLLRRVPWKILYNPQKMHLLGHITKLAESRGVPMEPRENMSYSCIGIIKSKDGK